MDWMLCIWACVFVGVVSYFAGGYSAIAFLKKNYGPEPLMKQAVKRGFAQYNQTTGAWEWKEKSE